MLAIYLATNEGRWQIAQRRGEQLWFNVGSFTRTIYVAGILVCVAGVLLPSSDWVVASDDWVTTGVFLFMVGLAVLTWPRTIVLDDKGVTEFLWGGLRRRKAEWSDIVHAVRLESDEDLEIQLILGNGKVIKHTKLHVDRTRFIHEVSRHVQIVGGPPRVL